MNGDDKKSNGKLHLTNLIIAVGVILFPDGTVHYFKIKPESQIKNNQIYIEKMMVEWFKANKHRYELRGIDLEQLSTAFASLQMLESDFDKLSKKEVVE